MMSHNSPSIKGKAASRKPLRARCWSAKYLLTSGGAAPAQPSRPMVTLGRASRWRSRGGTSTRIGDAPEADRIEDCQGPLADSDEAVAPEFGQNLAHVHRCEPGRVRDMMLSQREVDLQRVGSRHVALHQPLDQIEDQARDALIRGAAAEIDNQLVGTNFLLDPGSRQFLQQLGSSKYDVLQ